MHAKCSIVNGKMNKSEEGNDFKRKKNDQYCDVPFIRSNNEMNLQQEKLIRTGQA